ncbi:MAG: hypothetical protein ACUVQD_00365 [Thermaceae bacterium]
MKRGLAALLVLLASWTGPGRPAPREDLHALFRASRQEVVQRFLALKSSAHLLLGEEAAKAVARLIRLELQNQIQGKRSAFKTPMEALEHAQAWLSAIGQAKRKNPVHLDTLPTAPAYVLAHKEEIRAAASALRIPPGVLAAIVDNEQYGGDKALGLSRGVREWADSAALALAERGKAPFSRTLGLAQMSWEDALRQKPRLEGFGAWDMARPFPTSELEARKILEDPYFNLLFTASRLRGLFNALYNLPAEDTRPLEDPWLYYLGPAWHNYPFRAQNLETWEDSFHALFKGLFYQVILEDSVLWRARGRLLLPVKPYGPSLSTGGGKVVQITP